MDEWKVVSGGAGSYGYGSVVYIWDRRMGKKLWDLHNRYGCIDILAHLTNTSRYSRPYDNMPPNVLAHLTICLHVF